MQQEQQQSNTSGSIKGFDNVFETERVLFIRVADSNKRNTIVATKMQQKNKMCLPKEFSEEYLYSELVRKHNESVKKGCHNQKKPQE